MPPSRPEYSTTEQAEITNVITILDNVLKSHHYDLEEMRKELSVAEAYMKLNPALFDPIRRRYAHLFHSRVVSLLGSTTVIDRGKETTDAKDLLTQIRQKLQDTLHPPVFDKKDVKNLVREVLNVENRYDPDSTQRNPESVALQELMMSVDPQNFPKLRAFLKNPTGVLSERLVALAEMSDTQLRDEISAKEDQIKTQDNLIETNRLQLTSNHRLSPGERDKLTQEMKSALDEKGKLLGEVKDRQMVLAYQSGGFEYESVEQLLCMVQAFIDKEAGRVISPNGIEAKVDELVRTKAQKIYKGVRERNSISLKLTLSTLSETDEVFKAIGKDNMRALEKLESVSDIKAWQKKVESEAKIDPEYSRKTVLPRLIGILELSLNDKGIRQIKGSEVDKAKKLLASCKEIRKQYIEAEMKGKNYKSGIEKAADYSKIKAEYTDKDVTNSFREWARARAARNKLSTLVDWDKSITVKAYRASSDETKAKIKKLGLSAATRTAAGVGALAGLSLLGAPLALAGVGLVYKELLTKSNAVAAANRAIDGTKGLLGLTLGAPLAIISPKFRNAALGSLGKAVARPAFLGHTFTADSAANSAPSAPKKNNEKEAA